MIQDAAILFAQQGPFGPKGGFGGPGPGAGAGGPPPAFWVIFFAILGVLLLIGLAIQIFYLLTLSRCLDKCRKRNRTMEPGMVWLNLIPCFGTVWGFITVIRLSESLTNEFRDRREHRRDETYGYGLGLAYLILGLVAGIPYVGALAGIPVLICFIMYWVKIAGFSAQLDRPPRGDYDDEDDYDDRDRRRGRGRDDDDDDEDDDDRDRGRYRKSDDRYR